MVVDLLLIGLGITLEPFPITAFILLLGAEKGTRKGLAYILGWLACLVVVIAAVLAATGGQPPAPNTAPSDAALAVKLALGLVLILLAGRQWYRRGRPRKPPTWMARLDRLSLLACAGLAAFLQPWTLVAAGAATIVQANLSDAATWLVLSPVLPASHVQLSVPGALRDVHARRGRDPAAEAAGLAGHAHRPGARRGLPAAGVLAGGQEHLPARQLTGAAPAAPPACSLPLARAVSRGVTWATAT